MNFNVGDVLPAHYDLLTVCASYVVAVLGSLTALYHAQHMYHRDGSLRWPVAIGAAVALGGVGIWAMHFLGMMGYRLPLQVVYDGPLTAVSLAAPILIAGIALVLAGARGKFSNVGWVLGSLLAGAGVCVMHYMGLYAMDLRADMVLDLRLVAASVAIAVAAAAAALWLVFHAVRNTHRILAALAMGVAVCAVHYTGMEAAAFVCVSGKQPPVWAIGGENLPMLLFAVIGTVLVALCWNVLGILEKGVSARPVAVRRRAGARG